MTKEKNVLLVGVWKRNLGDDLFLKTICERFPMVRFHIVTDKKHRAAYETMHNLRLHFSNSFLLKVINRVLRMLRCPDLYYVKLSMICDGAVFLGGSLYQQSRGWEIRAKKSLDVARMYKACFIIGNNFGPYQDQAFFDFYHDVFRRMRGICFRDVYSARQFPDLPVRNAPDVVLMLGKSLTRLSGGEFSPKPLNRALSANECPEGDYLRERPYIVLSVIDLSLDHATRHGIAKYRDIYESWLSNLTLEIERKGMDAILISFCDQEGDDKACARILSLRNSERTSVYSHRDIERSLRLLEGAQGVVATRFHAMIVGWVLKKPVFPIAYGQKMISVITEYGYDGAYAKISELEKISPGEALESMRIFEKSEILAEAAKRQFDDFDEWLRS